MLAVCVFVNGTHGEVRISFVEFRRAQNLPFASKLFHPVERFFPGSSDESAHVEEGKGNLSKRDLFSKIPSNFFSPF